MFARAAITTALLIPTAFAWGPDGHATVADLGNRYFSDKANQAVVEIMGEGARIAENASWPDTVLHGPDRDEWEWSSGLHYADVDNCHFVYSRDCKDDYCVAGGIKNYSRQVADTSLPIEQRQVALKFLEHFIGDIHQPLHVGRRSDYGGNSIKVQMEFANKEYGALHKAWDEKMIDQFESEQYGPEYVQQDFEYGTDRTAYWTITVDDLAKEVEEGGKFHELIPGWLSDCVENGLDECVNTMVQESAVAACSKAYKHVNGSEIKTHDVLPFEYYQDRIETVKEQLAKGAVRFAWIMNNVFADTTVSTTSQPDLECDAYCDSVLSGSYCKYWQTTPVCHGNNIPCACSTHPEVTEAN